MTELVTERLRLHPWRDEDVVAMRLINADPDVMRLLGEGLPYAEAVSDEAAAGWRKHWADYGYGLFAATLRETGEMIGFIGLAQPFFMPEVMPSVEIGWRLAQEYWGKGLATEGAIACRDYGLGPLGLDRIISIIRPENTASWRVAEKIGMRIERVMDHPIHRWPLRIYERFSER
jgi:RimJ/RimL family protein N-acetyltransferase